MKVIYPKEIELIPVDNPVAGQKYHVSWANRGCVWKCIKIDGDTATLMTPKTKKTLTTHVSNLRHTRTDQFKIQSKNA